LKELHKEGYSFPLYKGDFLPLIDDVDSKNPGPHALDYWTGFYTNRPVYKSDIRIMMNEINLHNKLLAFIVL
jgi:hypothetical protein